MHAITKRTLPALALLCFMLLAPHSVLGSASKFAPINLIAESQEILAGRFSGTADELVFEVEKTIKGNISKAKVISISIVRPQFVFDLLKFRESLPGATATIFGNFSEANHSALAVSVNGIWPQGVFGTFASRIDGNPEFAETYIDTARRLLDQDGEALLAILANTENVPQHMAVIDYLSNIRFKRANVDHELAITTVFGHLRNESDQLIQKLLISLSPRVPQSLSLPWLQGKVAAKGPLNAPAMQQLVAYFVTRHAVPAGTGELSSSDVAALVESEIQLSTPKLAEIALRGLQSGVPSVQQEMRGLLASALKVDLRSVNTMTRPQEAEFWKRQVRNF